MNAQTQITFGSVAAEARERLLQVAAALEADR